MEPSGFEGRGGALVQEAKALLREDEEEAPKEVENAGPKIKMNRIRKKNVNRPGAGKAEATVRVVRPRNAQTVRKT